MTYTFTDGEVATAAKLNQIIPGRLTQAGVARVKPVANTPTSAWVAFPSEFPTIPQVMVTANTTVIGSTVKGVSVSNVTTKGFLLWVYRTDTAGTYVSWQAFAAGAAFTDGQFAYAGVLGQSAAALVAKAGVINITPVANTPTSLAVTFGTPFAATPTIIACPVTTVPWSVVKGVAVTSVTRTGFTGWIYRTSATPVDVAYIAMGRL